MEKDLILVTSFTPDVKRQKMLRDLVHNINKDTFDIMISSHTIVPLDISEKSDYLIYEKNNDLDYNFSNKFLFHYQNHEFSIFSTEPKKYNHFLAVIRHIISGLIYAKELGYTKVHYFEYDSFIENDSELIENSKLLDEYSSIYYIPPHLSYPNSPISFNLNKISPDWFNLSKEIFISFLREEGSTKTVEQYEWKLLLQSGNILGKDFNILKDRGINVALNADLESNKWIVPVFNLEDQNLYIFSWVETDQDIGSEVLVIVNDSHVIKIDRPSLGYWSTSFIGNKQEIKRIKIIVNSTITRDYDFDKSDIYEFIKYNYLSR